MKKKHVKSPLFKKYGLTSDKLAELFGYSNGHSLRNSTAYPRLKEGIEELIKLIETKRGN